MMYMTMNSILNNLIAIDDTVVLKVNGPRVPVAQGMKLFSRNKTRHFSAGHYTRVGTEGRWSGLLNQNGSERCSGET
jgi:hypothetical protein